ncbi:MAG: ABC transporter substrate-binding protein [Clostridiaceae bacterium]|nr:ABC transporter substrate-binding protein [Clostridiaceae bacterium]
MKSVLKLITVVLIVVCFLSLTGCSKLFDALNTEELNPDVAGDDSNMKIKREDSGPSHGGTLNLFMYKFNTLNPLTTKNKTVHHLSLFIFDTLFYKDDGELKNILARSFSVSQENTVYDVQIYDNVYFHDGKQLTAEDVVFTINAILDAGSRSFYYNNVSNIVSIKVIDRLSFRIILDKPDGEFTNKLTFPIVPGHIFNDWPVEGHSENFKLVGSGPFIFESCEDNQIILSRNDSWWLVDTGIIDHPVWIDNIVFKIYPNEFDMMSAFQKKEVDIAWIEDGDMKAYSRRTDILYNEFENNIIEFMAFSQKGTKNSPISRPDFRRALIEYLCWYSDLNPINNGNIKLNAIKCFNPYQKKTDRVTTLNKLEEYGFTYDEEKNSLTSGKNTAQITLKLLYNSINENRYMLGEWIKKALLEIGIQVDIQSASYEEEQQAVATGDFDIILLGCRIPFAADISDVPDLIKESLNMAGHDDVILPLYRKSGAVLYHNYIRGERRPTWNNIYNGWIDWYLVKDASE